MMQRWLNRVIDGALLDAWDRWRYALVCGASAVGVMVRCLDRMASLAVCEVWRKWCAMVRLAVHRESVSELEELRSGLLDRTAANITKAKLQKWRLFVGHIS